MTELESIISAQCITNVVKLESLTEDFDLEGKLFRLFLAPALGSDVKSGDILTVDAMLPYSGGEAVEVPVVVGDWSPVLFQGIEASAIDLTDVDAYVAPINYFKQ